MWIGRTSAMGYMVVAMLICFLCASSGLTSVDSYERLQNNGTFLTSPRSTSFVLAGRNKYKGNNDYNHVAGWVTPASSYGARVKIGIWGSQVQHHSQESGAAISISTDDQDKTYNMIEAGFHVLPELYNNNDVHFFIRWTKDDNKSTGCYNLECHGFVPASGAALVPGQAVAPPSTYGRDDRYITISLHTDPNTRDWVLYRDDLHKPAFLGHFPKELCPRLYGIAPEVALLGFVNYQDKDKGGPAMGSGHFPEEGQRKAAYFKNIKLFDSKANVYDPSGLVRLVTRPACYKVSDVLHAKKDGHMFYYGGPAGCMG
ncbi:unnamed protein product [Triticum aestivum]|uniref:Neprosin PEP catalytic domain-containing protein n=2 Tax=Triticum aestivum TaxID=4565 RepID=A0A9R1JEX7_WHEAT|nr:hypothetical protein CFC21_028403 [Triticum aestivum]SPT16624.1 unnamed protein product [Triticum aestivum]